MLLRGTPLSLPQKRSKGRWHRGPQPTWVVTNLRLSMAQPSHVITSDCMRDLLHRAPRAGSVPQNSPDHVANDALLHGCPSYESPCWNNSGRLLFRLSGDLRAERQV